RSGRRRAARTRVLRASCSRGRGPTARSGARAGAAAAERRATVGVGSPAGRSGGFAGSWPQDKRRSARYSRNPLSSHPLQDGPPTSDRNTKAPAAKEPSAKERAVGDVLRVTDSRTGKSYELPIVDGAIRANDLRKIKADDADFGLMSYDPAFMNTASCRSSVTYLDGDAGILRYRGYPIEQLAEKCTFLEVAWLLCFGELPTPAQLSAWEEEIRHHTLFHENLKQIIDAFRYD